jgi:HSP20 family protein
MDAAERTGAGVDQPASGFEHSSAPPPPPPAFGAVFEGFGGPGLFGPHGWGGPRGWGSPHGFGGPGRCARGRGPPGHHCHRREGDNDQAPPCERPGSPPNDENLGEPDEGPRNENVEGQAHGPRHGGPRHWGRRHGFHGPHGPWGRHRGAFDMSPLFQAFASHPIAQALRAYAEQAGLGADREAGETDAENNFTPPIDVFSTPAAYVLHVALPGAKKEDVGVNWDAEKSELNVAGVVYRQGDEEFLKTLSKKERRVGMFERSVKLPPGEEEKEEVDGDNITAKLEDGVLIVTVPKVEKEWTEVKKVDIE